MIIADNLRDAQICVRGKWVCAKPLAGPLMSRIRDSIKVIKGEAVAVKFIGQK